MCSTTMLCMCRAMCFKQIYGLVELIICATSCICDKCITYLFVGQLLMVLYGWVFLLLLILIVVISHICAVHK
jgi:hypothetical protein